MKKIEIKTEYIKLDQFLKWIDFTGTGGQAKDYIADGNILVNGEVETRRGRKLRDGDKIKIEKEEYIIEVSI